MTNAEHYSKAMVGLIDPRAPPSPRKSDDKQRNEKLQWHVSPLIRLAIRPEGAQITKMRWLYSRYV